MGDFNGIGPEVILKTLADNRILNFCTPVIYGNLALLNKVKKQLQLENTVKKTIRPKYILMIL